MSSPQTRGVHRRKSHTRRAQQTHTDRQSRAQISRERGTEHTHTHTTHRARHGERHRRADKHSTADSSESTIIKRKIYRFNFYIYKK